MVRRYRRAAEILRQKGVRLTPQRRMVIAAIEASDDHLSTEEIYARVRKQNPGVNISTIYRNLELLKELGLVTETDLGDGLLRYHYQEKGHHHHLICTKCGEVTKLDEPLLFSLRNKVLRQYGFRADLSHLAIFGRCRRCQEKA